MFELGTCKVNILVQEHLQFVECKEIELILRDVVFTFGNLSCLRLIDELYLLVHVDCSPLVVCSEFFDLKIGYYIHFMNLQHSLNFWCEISRNRCLHSAALYQCNMYKVDDNVCMILYKIDRRPHTFESSKSKLQFVNGWPVAVFPLHSLTTLTLILQSVLPVDTFLRSSYFADIVQ